MMELLHCYRWWLLHNTWIFLYFVSKVGPFTNGMLLSQVLEVYSCVWSNGRMARGQQLGAGSCYSATAGPVFISRWNGLIGVRAPGIKASCSETQAHRPCLSSNQKERPGICWWMRTKPWHNNTKWCLGWQKLICACSQKAVINEGEQGNAVPSFCSSLMGIEMQKKKKVSPLLRKWRSPRVHYSYSSLAPS